MDWLLEHTDEYETFWHITTRANVPSILKNGLWQTISGVDGDGVYCILKNLYNREQLDNVLNFMEQNDEDRNELVIVEFEYAGGYFINNVGTVYQEHQWIRIPSDISINLIDKIIEIDDV
ncbi:hypothetical protein QRD86_00275 (plasmid) [Bacillus halotolerans]|uniref:hypothetical protein n=1 Tax=Bacillus halotolerans TaxID=260554 RepID=UPI002570B44D|nr:hypothetical protein [Bacillus halotolerans]WJE41224.1 hypothetical protein QRD86_00275 [Bacillus halotolerans]